MTMLRSTLLFAAAWTHVDALVLRPGCYAGACRHVSSEVPIMAGGGPGDEEVKVTVRIKKPSPKASTDNEEVKVTVRKPLAKVASPPSSPSTLAIEASFVQAASGMGGANYEFGLMELIRAARDAYDEGVMVPALNLELSMCQQYTAGRPLQSDEVDLRTVWLSLVYLTFERVGYRRRLGRFRGRASRRSCDRSSTRSQCATPSRLQPPQSPLDPNALWSAACLPLMFTRLFLQLDPNPLSTSTTL